MRVAPNQIIYCILKLFARTARTRSEREGSVAGLCPAKRRGRLLRSRCRKAAGRPASKRSLREGLGQRPIQTKGRFL